MTNTDLNLTGLTQSMVIEKQQQYGKNELSVQKRSSLFKMVLHTLCEPMFLLLIIAAVVYFILGEPRDGAIMLIFVFGTIGIDVSQEWKTDKTLTALRDLSAPRITVIRDKIEQTIPSSELVPGDIMLICEGVKIPADGIIMHCSDLCVDESTLTGESEGVWKTVCDGSAEPDDYRRRDYCYAGTLVTQGSAVVQIEKTGLNTEYGKIGAGVANVPDEEAPLKRQTGKLVRICAVIAGVLFLLVGVFTWLNIPDHAPLDRLIESILSGVTLAMAMIPEEFPVILTVFLSMGAWRLAKKHSLVRRLSSVETLGAVSVLCVDKTGTITMNQMTVQSTWTSAKSEQTLLETMGLACEADAYDPMEKAMLRYCNENEINAEILFSGKLLAEYAFTSELKMMGHVWQKDSSIIIAAKGSPEKILDICTLTDTQKTQAEEKVSLFSSQGLRVIAVAAGYPESASDIPSSITGCRLTLLGLIGLSDPPREGVKNDIAVCTKAGIRVVMITGDNGATASAIAQKIGMPNCGHVITGDILEKMDDKELCAAVKDVSIFSRVIPEHKMRIVRAFKENGEIVAMTGDGVNDAPALKYSDIGIAMGKRGSEVSREAADLVLMDDNFTTIVETVRDGRRIYDNIRKAVGYVFTIHIPIAAASLLAPFLGIEPVSLLLLPLHVVLLELIIDPTCSIVLERQPAETNIMNRNPRNPKEKLLNAKLLIKSVIMGITMFAASFGAYFVTLGNISANAPVARSMGIAVIMLANLFLIQVISSESDFAIRSAARLIKDKVMWAVNIATLALLLLILYTPLSKLLKLSALSGMQLAICFALAAASVLWYELVKLVKKLKK